jgi:hypothetical protein
MATMRSRFILLKRKTRPVPIPLEQNVFNCVGNLIPAMGARNHVGIGLSYQLCSLATHFQTRFLESIPRPIAGLKFPTQNAS